ncbi:MAG: DUF2007 domain-containing protein [Paludibacteraceae bacterium]|nr:DUF2007 domain-containing protein [Paludibacteraceae bacterium]
MKTIVFKTYTDMVTANMECNVLKENGIECFLSDENIVQLYPMFSSPFSGIRLHLFEKDKDSAEKILQEFYSTR